MKTILFCNLLMIVSCLEIRANILIAIKNGKWHDYKSWDINRIPHSSDTVIIPDGIAISVMNNIRILKSSKNDGKLILFGELNLNKNVSLIINDDSWINCLENGSLIGNRGSKIIVDEQLKFSFRKKNEKYQLITKNQSFMLQRFNIRLNDTLLNDYLIRNSENLTFVEVQHSYDGKSWEMLDRIKVFSNETNECRIISLKKVVKRGNVDFIKLIGYSSMGRLVLLNVSQFSHDTQKIENRKKLITIPRTIVIVSVASMGSRFAKMMSTF